MPLSDSDIQRITEAVRSRLGANPDKDTIARAVRTAASEIESPPPDAVSTATPSEPVPVDHPELEANGGETGRFIVAAFGHNRPGVAAALTTVLAECNCDIADITQKILQEFFSMIMIVDITRANVDFATLRHRLSEIESRLGITILAQHQDVYRSMHRI